MYKHLALAAALAAAPFAASASDLSYTYAEGDFVLVNVDGTNQNPMGASLRGSAELGASNAYVFGGYTYATTSVDYYYGEFDINVEALEAGIGYALPVGARADILFEGAASHAKVDEFTENFYRLSVGARGAFTDKLDGWVRVNYSDTTDDFAEEGSAGGVSVAPGLQYRFGQTWGAVGELDIGDDGQTLLLGLRANF